MTDEETCSQGRDVRYCCASDTHARIDREATGWRHGQLLADAYDLALDSRVIAVARALGIDPHALDDDVQGRGWEYHDREIERAIAQGLLNLLPSSYEGPDTFYVPASMIADDRLSAAIYLCQQAGVIDAEHGVLLLPREMDPGKTPTS